MRRALSLVLVPLALAGAFTARPVDLPTPVPVVHAVPTVDPAAELVEGDAQTWAKWEQDQAAIREREAAWAAAAELDAYNQWLAEQAALARQRVAVASSPRIATTITGDCAAFLPYVPASVIDRESRGDPNAVNSSSGALGCVQLMPGHFSSDSPWNSDSTTPGACAGYDPATLAGQVSCAAKLSNGGTNLDPWRL